MRVQRVRGGCPDGNICPTLHVTDRETFLFQGYVIRDVPVASDSVAVWLPASLFPELPDRSSAPHVTAYGPDSVMVVGRRVVDASARAALAVPDGEDVVEVAFSAVPELAKVAVAC